MLDFLLSHWGIPDTLARIGARYHCRDRLNTERKKFLVDPDADKIFLEEMSRSPLFLSADTANEQHYEVPPEFFRLVMGERMKYSCGYWTNDGDNLTQAEEAALALTCANAKVTDGETILELGCGWGSLSLYLAERYPASEITAVSNSSSQKQFIKTQQKKRGIENLNVITANVGELELDRKFEKIISVEMFEHARNYTALLEKISQWLVTEGELFVHIFVHKHLIYPYNSGEGSWMADYFFKDGLMPAYDIFERLPHPFDLITRRRINGTHYAKTCEAWLSNHKRHRSEILSIFEATYGQRQARKFWNYWKLFFIGCAELFAYRGGDEWFVGHYLMRKRAQK